MVWSGRGGQNVDGVAGARRPGRPREAAKGELGQLLERGMAARSAARGAEYTVVDLARDAELDFSYVARVLRAERQPAREFVMVLARALAPYVSEDDALLAAGYAPSDRQLVELARRIARMGGDGLARIEAVIGEWVSEQPGKEQAGKEGGGAEREDTPAADAGEGEATA